MPSSNQLLHDNATPDTSGMGPPSNPGVAVSSNPGAAPAFLYPGIGPPSNPGVAPPSNPGMGPPFNPGMAPAPLYPGMGPPANPATGPPSNPGVAPPFNPGVANVPGADAIVNGLPISKEGEEQFQPVVMPVMPGYEFVNPVLKHVAEPGDINSPPPPTYEQVIEKPSPSPDYSKLNNPHVDETSARAAIIEETSKHRCYGSGAAQRLTFSKITTTQAYHVTLNTFIETRETYWAKLPYVSGQPVDGPEYGPAPAPWDLPCVPSKMFEEQTFLIETPHTSHVMTCPQCTSFGRVRCGHCCGMGHSMCLSCHGLGRSSTYTNGRWESRRCFHCSGRGHNICFKCSGQGHIVCPCCTGFRLVRMFIQLRVKFMNVLHDTILYSGEKPYKGQIALAGGYEQWRLEAPLVKPLEEHREAKVIESSRELVNKARQDHQSSRILMQRHVVRTVPVTECSYVWKNKDHMFWVYGTDHQVLLIDYPQTCGCCNIM